ncbi:mechanosensitive ion channel family protein [Cupriavidus sp. DB3]|uniref:mechanosensitive ion channel family protein n=1 Tax=Cupriavidus sp. DB3 TaxID=2873259 RepID=UPI001CF0E39E|nr:mechanosensitive ion channel family protein [Cupriavidus sp. DB3]MCA7083810.1 mechanosensitive ion channel family protein [Cupriavidus sp. DB3]
MKLNLDFNDSILLHIVLSVLIVLVGVLLVKLSNRFFVSRQLADRDNLRSYRTWTVASRNLIGAVVFLLLLGIWVSELKSVAISLAAFAAALMISGKELVMCFLGAFMRMLTRPFQLGDLVEIGQYAGEVIDMDALTTTLVEVAPTRQFTGFTVQVPNSLLLTVAVRNHSQAGKYTLDTVRIPLAAQCDPDRIEAELLDIAQQACEPFLEAAGQSLRRYGDTRFLELSQFAPRVMFEPVGTDRLDAIVRFPAPVGGRLPVAQQIIRRFYRQRMSDSKEAGADAAAEAATEADQREAAEDRARMARAGRPGTAGGPGAPDASGPPASSPAF